MGSSEAAKKSPIRTGRPPFDISEMVLYMDDDSAIARLASLGLTKYEIGGLFGVSNGTIDKLFNPRHHHYDPGFVAAYEKGRAQLIVSLKGRLLEGVQRGNTILTIFACKALIGMREQPVELEVRNNTTIATVDLDTLVKSRPQIAAHLASAMGLVSASDDDGAGVGEVIDIDGDDTGDDDESKEQ